MREASWLKLMLWRTQTAAVTLLEHPPGSGAHSCFPASVHSQAGRGCGQPGLGEGVPAHGWGLDEMIWGPFQPSRAAPCCAKHSTCPQVLTLVPLGSVRLHSLYFSVKSKRPWVTFYSTRYIIYTALSQPLWHSCQLLLSPHQHELRGCSTGQAQPWHLQVQEHSAFCPGQRNSPLLSENDLGATHQAASAHHHPQENKAEAIKHTSIYLLPVILFVAPGLNALMKYQIFLWGSPWKRIKHYIRKDRTLSIPAFA